jgi:hypothetical protein
MRIRRESGPEGLQALLELEPLEVELLQALSEQYLGLIQEDDDDPALTRLFPAGYRDDPAAAAEFAELTRGSLRSRKAENTAAVLESLNQPTIRLDGAAMARWLPYLTDLRLVLAERMGIRADGDDIPDTSTGGVYEWLGYLQQVLLTAIDPEAE